jgi:hypothetical protein
MRLLTGHQVGGGCRRPIVLPRGKQVNPGFVKPQHVPQPPRILVIGLNKYPTQLREQLIKQGYLKPVESGR